MSHLREDEQRLLRSCNVRDDFWPTNMVTILSRLEEERDKAEKVSGLLADSTKALTEARAEVVRLKELMDIDPFCYTIQGDDSCLWCRRDRPLLNAADTWKVLQSPEYHDSDCAFILAMSPPAESAEQSEGGK